MSNQTTWKDPGNRIRLVGDLNRFAFRLFGQVYEENSGNLFLSPSSISTALAMAFAGSGSHTRDEFAAALGFSLAEDELHQAFRDLPKYTRTGGVDFHCANRLWGQVSYRFLENFLQTTQDCYGARLAEVDFKNDVEAGRRTINSWVAQHTANRISNLVPPGCLDHMARLVLTNAVYFLGTWDQPFERDNTSDADFFSVPGSTSSVSMMHQSGLFSYTECESFKVIELPYLSHAREAETGSFGKQEDCGSPATNDGSDFTMIVILPNSYAGLGDLVQELCERGLQCVPRREYREVRVFLPKFRIEAGLALSGTLQVLGVRSAFAIEKADFSRMSDDPEGLFISEVLHKACVEVNEEGTEAAAATAMFHIGAGPPPPPPVEFKADHPFIFLIRDTLTGLIHFIGRYMGPQAA